MADLRASASTRVPFVSRISFSSARARSSCVVSSVLAVSNALQHGGETQVARLAVRGKLQMISFSTSKRSRTRQPRLHRAHGEPGRHETKDTQADQKNIQTRKLTRARQLRLQCAHRAQRRGFEKIERAGQAPHKHGFKRAEISFGTRQLRPQSPTARLRENRKSGTSSTQKTLTPRPELARSATAAPTQSPTARLRENRESETSSTQTWFQDRNSLGARPLRPKP